MCTRVVRIGRRDFAQGPMPPRRLPRLICRSAIAINEGISVIRSDVLPPGSTTPADLRIQKSRSRTDPISFFSIFWNRPAAAQL